MELYRYELKFWHEERERFTIIQKDYFILKTTNKGYWIEFATHENRRRFILKDCKKAFARDSKKEAMADFIARKKRYGKIIRRLESINKLVIKKAESITENELNIKVKFVNEIDYGY